MPRGIYVRKPSALRDKVINENFAKGRTKEARAKAVASIIKVWTEEKRKECSIRTKRAMHRPDVRDRHVASVRKVLTGRTVTAETVRRQVEACRKTILAGLYNPSENYATTRRSIITSKGGTITVQSNWELQFAFWLDRTKHVLSFTKDKVRIPYTYNGKRHVYIVDFLVKYWDKKQELIEVKPSCLTGVDEMPAKFTAATTWCQQNNIDFVVITENELKLLEGVIL